MNFTHTGDKCMLKIEHTEVVGWEHAIRGEFDAT